MEENILHAMIIPDKYLVSFGGGDCTDDEVVESGFDRLVLHPSLDVLDFNQDLNEVYLDIEIKLDFRELYYLLRYWSVEYQVKWEMLSRAPQAVYRFHFNQVNWGNGIDELASILDLTQYTA